MKITPTRVTIQTGLRGTVVLISFKPAEAVFKRKTQFTARTRVDGDANIAYLKEL